MQNQVGDEVYCFDFFETEDRMIKKKKRHTGKFRLFREFEDPGISGIRVRE